MAKQLRSVDFLPEIFQTPVNKQFLSATLDQLIQNPQFTQTQGFIGRRVGPGVNANDKYVVEPTKIRTDYQLEPGVVQTDPADTHRVIDAITYPGINDALKLQGAVTNNADSLYTSDYYTWDPFVDFDKFVNYAQYYWLPEGPLAWMCLLPEFHLLIVLQLREPMVYTRSQELLVIILHLPWYVEAVTLLMLHRILPKLQTFV